MQAVIVTGGYGTRMNEVVDVPKCCALVGGYPFLYHLLYKLTARGEVNDIFFCLGHRASEVWQTACAWEYGLSFGDFIPSLYKTTEQHPLGTGGALTKLLTSKKFDLGRTFLVVWGDVLPVWSVDKFIRTVMDEGGPTTVTVSDGGDRNNLEIAANKKNSFLLVRNSKNPTHLDNGIYMINRDDYLKATQARFGTLKKAAATKHDIWHVLPSLMFNPEYPSCLYNVGQLRVHDVGQPDRFQELKDELAFGWWPRYKLRRWRDREARKAALETGETTPV